MTHAAIRETADGVELTIKVVPGASRDRIAGALGDALKVAVSAPPEKGKANKCVIDVLANALGIKRNAIEIVAGHTQPRKTVRIRGLTADEVRAKLKL